MCHPYLSNFCWLLGTSSAAQVGLEKNFLGHEGQSSHLQPSYNCVRALTQVRPGNRETSCPHCTYLETASAQGSPRSEEWAHDFQSKGSYGWFVLIWALYLTQAAVFPLCFLLYYCIYKGQSCLFSALAFLWLKSQTCLVWCLKMASPLIPWSAPASRLLNLFLQLECGQGKLYTATLWGLPRAVHVQWALHFICLFWKSLPFTVLRLSFPLSCLVWLWKLSGKSRVRALGHHTTCICRSSLTLVFGWQDFWWLQRLG